MTTDPRAVARIQSLPAWAAHRDDWRRFGPTELARQYSARGTVPDSDGLIRDYRERSRPMYELPQHRRLRYGEHGDEILDLFPVPGLPSAPLFVFIHGGYWRSLALEDSVFMARNFTSHGIAVAAINYSLAPAARLDQIVVQCRSCLAWLYQNGASHGIDAGRIVVAGSSAGGHLGAMLAAPGWQAGFGLPESVVQGAVLVSGLFDLLPVRETTPNEWLNLNAPEALALSPIEALPPASVRLCIAVAEKDTNEFKRQSSMYAAACKRGGSDVRWLEVADRNHFDVVMDWMSPTAT